VIDDPDVTDIKLVPSPSDIWEERFSGWPSLQINVELAPWYWRVSWYRAPVDGHFLLLQFGPLILHLWA
jgi:hypothetical protein